MTVNLSETKTNKNRGQTIENRKSGSVSVFAKGPNRSIRNEGKTKRREDVKAGKTDKMNQGRRGTKRTTDKLTETN